VVAGTLISRMRHSRPSRLARREATQMESGAVRDVVILGSGPAGLTAAIYSARADCIRWCSKASRRRRVINQAASSC